MQTHACLFCCCLDPGNVDCLCFLCVFSPLFLKLIWSICLVGRCNKVCRCGRSIFYGTRLVGLADTYFHFIANLLIFSLVCCHPMHYVSCSPWTEGPYKDAAPTTALGGLTINGFLSEVWLIKCFHCAHLHCVPLLLLPYQVLAIVAYWCMPAEASKSISCA